MPAFTIRDYIGQLQAGGPGSGRHPEGGDWQGRVNVHVGLQKMGFSPLDRDLDSYRKGKHLVQVNREGKQSNWVHYSRGMEKGRGTTFQGLHNHMLKTFGGK